MSARVFVVGVGMTAFSGHWCTRRLAVGAVGGFCVGLERGVLRAARRDACGASWFRPRPFCRADVTRTVRYNPSGTATVHAATRVHVPPLFGGVHAPRVPAAVRFNGVEGGLIHGIFTADSAMAGARVNAVMPDRPVARPLLRIVFAVEEGMP